MSEPVPVVAPPVVDTPSPTIDELSQTLESTPAPQPITPESVVSTPPETPPAPDSSILSDKIDKMLTREDSIQQRRTQEQEYESMQEELRILRTMQGPEFQQKYNQVTEKVEQADDDQSSLMKELQKELTTMRESQDRLQTELKQKEQDTELTEASNEVTQWVTDNEEQFPLTNAAGYQATVFQKMWNTKQQTGHMISETQAGRDIEEELTGVVTALAPLLGFIKSEQKAEREAPISTTTSGLQIAEPADRDSISEEDRLSYMVRNWEADQG